MGKTGFEPDAGRSTGTQHEIEGLVGEVAAARLSRREFVTRATLLGLSVGAIGTLLAACGGSETDETPEAKVTDTTIPEKLYIYNWSDYMSPNAIKKFESETGIKCEQTYYDGNEELTAKLKAGATGYDVIFPTDMWVSVLSKSGLLRALDMSLIPNFKYVTTPLFQKPPFDDESDGNKYSVPYMFGSTGVGRRTDKVSEPVTSWNTLWDETYKRQINMLNTPRETIGVALMRKGYSVNTTDQAQLDEATADLIEQKPLVMAYDSANTRRNMVIGVPLVHCWDGDAALASREVDEGIIDYTLPSEGYIVWADGIAIPKDAPSVYAAHLFLDFLLDPVNAGECANYIGYQPVVSEAAQYIEDPVQKAMRPTDEEINQGQFAEDLGNFERAYGDAWAEVKSA
jgi:spermidine/putrescine transport system substrate-binding protein